MKKRLYLTMALFAAALTLLAVRIGFLQLYGDEPLAVMAEGQYLTELTEAAQRAGIFDRYGREITGGTTYAYYCIPEDISREKSDENEEEDGESGHGADLLERLGCHQVRGYESGFCVWKGEYNESDQARIEKEYGALTVLKKERYSDNQPAVHLIGYTADTGENGEEEGQCGLEKMYDERLSEGTVRKYLTRDATGRILMGNGAVSDSEISEMFQTTIDLDLQKKAEELLEESGRPGAVAVSSVKTGELLACASSPSYNPNDLGAYLDSSESVLTDRVCSGTYPPGSVFKLVVAAAAIEAGIADEDSVFECTGSIETGGVTVGCSTGGEEGHGKITLREALADSCNCAFIQLGMETGGQRIIEMAEAMGLGEDVCPQLSENTGYLPESAEECGIANLSIGQGTILVTPLQITSLMNCIASGGIRQPLKILMPETEQDLTKYGVCPDIVRENEKKAGGKTRVISEETAESLLSMMNDTVRTGTAESISEYTDELPGGKTGSAQSVMSGSTVVHGWFSGFFPQDDPEYVITVFLEDGGGGSACLPTAGGIVRYLSGEE